MEKNNLRKQFEGHVGIFDTFIFKLKDIKDKTENIKIFKKGIGTKNIPDALKWHCSFYWRYMLSNKNIKNSRSSSSLLDKHSNSHIT